ncbi:hypothetical protein D1821_12675 [Phaeobacter inhibens]|nr:hypothetical protein D1821_12675 [Phaeobacter inhibens]
MTWLRKGHFDMYQSCNSSVLISAPQGRHHRRRHHNGSGQPPCPDPARRADIADSDIADRRSE